MVLITFTTSDMPELRDDKNHDAGFPHWPEISSGYLKVKRLDTFECNAYQSVQSAQTSLLSAIQDAIRRFLWELPYRSPQTQKNPKLRGEVVAEIESWDAGLAPDVVDQITDTACGIAECAYAHTSYEHQRFVALYTACLTFVDDLGHKDIEVVGLFVQRFVRGDTQPVPALVRLQALLATVHEYYPRIGADAIVSSTLDGVAGMYIELVTKGHLVRPSAARYPYYLRLRTGVASGYAHFNFTEEWSKRAGPDYLQMLPELEAVTIGFNDILSFYKETLAGERDNYIHMRAQAEKKSPLAVLIELVEENLESVRKINELAKSDYELAMICQSYLLGYAEFHLKAGRYRLEDIAGMLMYV